MATSVPHSWIEGCVGDVQEEIDHHVEQGHEQHEALDRREVTAEQRVVRVLAHARPGKDDLDEHLAAQCVSVDGRDYGEDRDHRVLERVPQYDDPKRQAYGSGGPDVVGLEHLDHDGPGHPCDGCHGDESERETWQDKRFYNLTEEIQVAGDQ